MKLKIISTDENYYNIKYVFLRIIIEVLIHATTVGNNKSQCVGRKTGHRANDLPDTR